MTANHQIGYATVLLYLVLGLASFGVTLKTRAHPHSQLRLQVNSWWLLFPAVSLSLLLYPLGPALLALLIGALALRELAPHCRHSRYLFRLLCMALLALLIGASWYQPQWALRWLPCLVLAQFVYFLYNRQTEQLLLLLFLFMCCGIGFIIQLTHLPLAAETKLAWLFYLFVMTALNDIGQFISGKSFGKQRIAARISPNKTWQGLAGGILVSVVISLTLGAYLRLAAPAPLLALALSLAVGGFTGDILFSAAKRFLGIKDFSQLIPGHGGILDRVDSLVLTAPLLYFAIVLFL